MKQWYRHAIAAFAALGPAASIVALPASPVISSGSSVLEAVAESNNAFGLALYDQLRRSRADENLFFSPASVSTALAMAYAGARGPTATDMATTLRWTLEGDELHGGLARMTTSLHRDQPGCSLALANALWGQSGLPFRREFLTVLGEHYGAGLREVDFENAAEQARLTINAWTATQTRDRIRDLLRRDNLSADTALVLTNAIWFKGTWQTRFDRELTRSAPFYVDPRTTVEVDMMSMRRQSLRYFSGDGLEILELPYTGDTVSMILVLPKQGHSLEEIESRLTPDVLRAWLSSLRVEQVDSVEMPRFETDGRFELADVLGSMGMARAFSRNADFSGISDDRVFLDEVIHQAFVQVDEEGTEAAAATAVVARKASVSPRRHFRADHPFMFMIRDRATGSLLFLGRLTKP